MSSGRTIERVSAGKFILPRIYTVKATSEQAITVNGAYTDINSMTLTITVPVGNAKLLCEYTHRIKMDSTNWEQHYALFYLDGSATDNWAETKDVNAVTSQYWIRSYHSVMSDVAAGEHIVKMVHYTNSDLNVKIYDRRLTVMVGQ